MSKISRDFETHRINTCLYWAGALQVKKYDTPGYFVGD